MYPVLPVTFLLLLFGTLLPLRSQVMTAPPVHPAPLVVTMGGRPWSFGNNGAILPGDTGTVRFYPESDTVNLGSTGVGCQIARVDSILNATNRPIRLQIAIYGNSHGAFDMYPHYGPIVIGPGRTDGYTIFFRPRDTGEYRATLRIFEEGSGATLERLLIGRGVRLPDVGVVQMEAGDVEFGEVYVKTLNQRTVKLINTGPVPRSVVGAFTNQGTDFEVNNGYYHFELEPHEAQDVMVSFQPQVVGEQYNRFEVFDVSDPSHTSPVAGFNLHGNAIDARLRGPDSLIVELKRAGCDTQPIYIENLSGRTVTINEVMVDDPTQGFTVKQVLPDPLKLYKDGWATIWIEYCDVMPRTRTTTLRLLYDSQPQSELLITLVGQWSGPGRSGIVVDTLLLDFKEVDSSQCRDDTITVTNNTPGSLIFNGGMIANKFGLPDSSTAFTLLDPQQSALIPQGGSIDIVIRYCADNLDISSALWIGTFNAGGVHSNVTVELVGRRRIDEGIRIWLDTNRTAVAGESARMQVRVNRGSGVTLDSVALVFDPTALVFASASTPDGVPASARFSPGGDTVTVWRMGSPDPPTGDTLLIVRFVGLTSGQPVNAVNMGQLWVRGVARPRVDSTGLLYLSGCEIGGDYDLVLKGAIRGIILDPASRSATIRYRMPQGSTPQLALLDITGARVMVERLADGSGEEQGVLVDLSSLPPGFYLVEIATGSDSAFESFILAR